MERGGVVGGVMFQKDAFFGRARRMPLSRRLFED